VGQYGYYTDVETNDIYIRARSYNPSLGRWLTRDPIGFADGWNQYAVATRLASTDPNGTTICKCNSSTYYNGPGGSGGTSTNFPSIIRNSTLASWLGISAHCVTWTNTYIEGEAPLPALSDTCIKGPKNLVLDLKIPGGPEHSIMILTTCDCSGNNCKCFGIDNGLFGGVDHIFELPIKGTANGTLLPQQTIDQINEFLRQNAPGCLKN